MHLLLVCTYIYLLHLNNVEMKALKHEVFDLDSTKNELSDKLHLCKQSLKSVEETLQGNHLTLSEYLST